MSTSLMLLALHTAASSELGQEDIVDRLRCGSLWYASDWRATQEAAARRAKKNRVL